MSTAVPPGITCNAQIEINLDSSLRTSVTSLNQNSGNSTTLYKALQESGKQSQVIGHLSLVISKGFKLIYVS
ncbi:hypothetical protein LC605_06790 [Nostoc sp. CHAB 5836]|nr:hypothetical protein [Nostoc sp. CHAB 5836]